MTEKGFKQDRAVLLSAPVLTLSLLLIFTKSLKPLCSSTAARLKTFLSAGEPPLLRLKFLKMRNYRPL